MIVKSHYRIDLNLSGVVFHTLMDDKILVKYCQGIFGAVNHILFYITIKIQNTIVSASLFFTPALINLDFI